MPFCDSISSIYSRNPEEKASELLENFREMYYTCIVMSSPSLNLVCHLWRKGQICAFFVKELILDDKKLNIGVRCIQILNHLKMGDCCYKLQSTLPVTRKHIFIFLKKIKQTVLNLWKISCLMVTICIGMCGSILSVSKSLIRGLS